MLPMNKVCEDIKKFVSNMDESHPVGSDGWTREREKVVLFANELSEKYGEHVDIKLVKSLIVNIQDSIEKDETNGI